LSVVATRRVDELGSYCFSAKPLEAIFQGGRPSSARREANTELGRALAGVSRAQREFLGLRTGIRMWCSIGITLKSNGWHGDDRAFGKPLFKIIIFRLVFSQTEPPAVIMDHDADMIQVVEGRCAASERGIIEVPVRRSDLPNEPGKIVTVFVVAKPPAFCGKIVF
jgi:hypothetical protein